jgi:site-specific DNA-methyltransferase (adenine-specific)
MCIDMEIALHTKKKENEQVEKVLTFSDVSITKIESKDSITEQVLINGDCEEILFEINDNSIDFMATDPPYGLSFMGKNWDKVLPPTEIWRECYRVLKPGAFIAVMSSPRSDLLYRMIKDLEDAGFDMSFSPIYWTMHSGFPKASDTSKMIDKRFGAEREVVGEKKDGMEAWAKNGGRDWESNNTKITAPSTDLAKKYEGSKLGFQPKPAVEHIIIGMKPHGSKSYIDNVLNFEALPDNIKMTYPFIQVPKPAKKEKDFGLDNREASKSQMNSGGIGRKTSVEKRLDIDGTNTPLSKNIHPTTKPVKLMSYIITLFTREGDWVIDPFLGSGTSGIASKLLNRNFIGVEREKEYFDICEERLSVDRDELIKFFKDKK